MEQKTRRGRCQKLYMDSYRSILHLAIEQQLGILHDFWCIEL